MIKNLIILILATVGLCSCGKKSKSTIDNVVIDLEILDSTTNGNILMSLTNEPNQYIYTDTLYKFSTGNNIRIQNSFPKSGGTIEGPGYNVITGKNYAYAIFWTRVINESETALDLSINFPADSLSVFTSPGSYLKLFLPSDKMTADKQSLYDYGITELKSYLDINFNKRDMLKKTLQPNKEYLFYVAALSYRAEGKIRAGFVLKDQELFYSISIEPHGSGLIPCGRITF